MSTRETPWPDGTPCWTDLAVPDTDQARSFYQQLFGWEIPAGDPQMGGYARATKDGHAAAGIGKVMMEGAPTAWLTHLAVSDIDAIAKSVTENGGQIMMPPMDVMGMGHMAIAVDPAGAAFGLWQAASFNGAAIVNQPGAFTWSEQFSSDFEGSKKFYAAVFGWDVADVPGGMSYASFKVDGTDVGGIGSFPGAPTGWTPYFAVDNVDESVDKVVKLNGNVLMPAADTPFGRMATVSDDQGAVFKIMQLPAQD